MEYPLKFGLYRSSKHQNCDRGATFCLLDKPIISS
jgi:hypothetical protein